MRRLRGLVGIRTLLSMAIAWNAPPAFLLDADRRTSRRRALGPGDFDNRSVSFPTDFPSASFLISHCVRRVVLVQSTSSQPQSDLAHTLRRWQDGGVQMLRCSMGQPDQPETFNVDRPRWYRAIWYQLLASAGLRRNILGGFGGILPDVEGSSAG